MSSPSTSDDDDAAAQLILMQRRQNSSLPPQPMPAPQTPDQQRARAMQLAALLGSR